MLLCSLYEAHKFNVKCIRLHTLFIKNSAALGKTRLCRDGNILPYYYAIQILEVKMSSFCKLRICRIECFSYHVQLE